MSVLEDMEREEACDGEVAGAVCAPAFRRPAIANPGAYFGEGTVDEAALVSPGAAGRVFNPIIIAEFRRWRARPFTYLSMVLVVFAGLVSLYQIKQGAFAAMAMRAGNVVGVDWVQYGMNMINLVFRPSTILPLMMVWRALVSFRDGGLYKPFRTTFLTPGEFLWGIVTVPFLMSAVILVIYTGAVLAPSMIEMHFAQPADRRNWWAAINVLGILFEGSMNGALICFVAMYFGLRGGARLGALFPVLAAVLVIQSAQAVGYTLSPRINGLFMGRTGEGWTLLQRTWQFWVFGTPKVLLAAVFWWLTTRHLAKRDYH